MSAPYTIDQEFATDVITFLKRGQTFETMVDSMASKGWNPDGLAMDISQCLDTDADALALEKDLLRLWINDDPSHKEVLDDELSQRPLQDVSTFLMNETVDDLPVMVSEGLLQQYLRDPAFWGTRVEYLEQKLTADPVLCSQFVDSILNNPNYATTDAAMSLLGGTTKKTVERNPAYRSVFIKAHPHTAAGRAMATLQLFEDRLFVGCTFGELESLYKPKHQAAHFRSLHTDTQNAYFDSFHKDSSYQRRLQFDAVRNKLQTEAVRAYALRY
jgi:hypothetical protein